MDQVQLDSNQNHIRIPFSFSNINMNIWEGVYSYFIHICRCK
jgi:hypothetical protein